MADKITLGEYQKFCQKTAIVHKSKKVQLAIWGLGAAGEVGDLVGCIKKTLYHGNDQKLGIRENIGDTMWYLAMICNTLEWNFEEILGENVEKLKARYPKGFTKKAARRKRTRVDWNER